MRFTPSGVQVWRAALGHSLRSRRRWRKRSACRKVSRFSRQDGARALAGDASCGAGMQRSRGRM